MNETVLGIFTAAINAENKFWPTDWGCCHQREEAGFEASTDHRRSVAGVGGRRRQEQAEERRKRHRRQKRRQAQEEGQQGKGQT